MIGYLELFLIKTIYRCFLHPTLIFVRLQAGIVNLLLMFVRWQTGRNNKHLIPNDVFLFRTKNRPHLRSTVEVFHQVELLKMFYGVTLPEYEKINWLEMKEADPPRIRRAGRPYEE